MQEKDYFGNYREPVLAWTGAQGIAVIKPGGMHTAPGTCPDGSSLADWVFQRFPAAAKVLGRCRGEGGLIHRLDRGTEGLVLFALTDEFFNHITQQAAAGLFLKSYLALTEPGCGGLDGSKPLLASPFGVQEDHWMDALRRQDLDRLGRLLSGTKIESRFRPYGPGSKRVACLLSSYPGTMKAWTKDLYSTQITAAYPGETGLLVDARLTRGFRHQVRAHLAWLGLSLQGDTLYGEGEDRDDIPANRAGLRLLAYALSFTDPDSGTNCTITLPHLAGADSDSRAC